MAVYHYWRAVFCHKAWKGGHLRQSTYSILIIAQSGAESFALGIYEHEGMNVICTIDTAVVTSTT